MERWCIPDLIPTSAHLRGAWVMAYDLFPLDTIAAKRRLLERVVERQWTLVLEHDPGWSR